MPAKLCGKSAQGSKLCYGIVPGNNPWLHHVRYLPSPANVLALLISIHLMRQYLLLFVLIIFCANNVAAQASLTVVGDSLINTTVSHGQSVECVFTITNAGSDSAPNSTAYVGIAADTSLSSAAIVTGSSVRPLAVGDTTTLYYTFTIPSYLASGTYYVYIALGAYHAVVSVPLTVTADTSYSVKIPYPIILIHGLNSSDTTWNDFTGQLNSVYGFQCGGIMNFCLNADGDIYYSDVATDYKDFTDTAALQVGDYYLINFAADSSGAFDADPYATTYMYSNQSAIFKQGVAVKDAIAHVLQKTGRDKVVLVGHSMGGLASREYIENYTQPDGKDHVAKLFTIGTPHGGSDATITSLGSYLLTGVDNYSEAVRDLRYPYLFTFYSAYLFGGTEASLGSSYENDDVNCNGYVGDTIVGLNYKWLPDDVIYACTIGTGALTGGDGVVDADRADINNYPGSPYLPYAADTFIDNEFAYFESHTDLPKNFEINMKGLDEANTDSSDFPYHIALNNSYYGFVQQQSLAGYARDYDNYAFQCTQKGTLEIKIENIIAPDFKLWLVDATRPDTSLYSFPISSNEDGNIDVRIQVPEGKYIIRTDAAPVTNGYYYPYLLKTMFTPNWDTTDYTICAGAPRVLTAPPGFAGYQWSYNGAIIPGAIAQVLSADSAGYYAFQTTNSLGYTGPWSDSVHITVNPLPNAGTITGVDTVCVGARITLSDTASGGFWSAVTGNASVDSGVATGIAEGSDTVIYDVRNSCGDARAKKTLRITSCGPDFAATVNVADAVSIYPNPAEHTLTIKAAAPIRQVTISNLLGQTVFSGTYNAPEVEIDLTPIPSGIFIVKINNASVYRVVKE
jgi:pimeloyl-ACP methyl ester carboxylesterase